MPLLWSQYIIQLLYSLLLDNSEQSRIWWLSHYDIKMKLIDYIASSSAIAGWMLESLFFAREVAFGRIFSLEA